MEHIAVYLKKGDCKMENFISLFYSFLGIYFPVLVLVLFAFWCVEVIRSGFDLSALIYDGYMDTWLLVSPLIALLITLFGIYKFGF